MSAQTPALKMEDVDCLACGESDRVPARIRSPRDPLARELGLLNGRSSWVVCRNCGLVFQSPRPKQDIVDGLYAEGGYHEARGGVPEHYIRYSLRRSVPALDWFMATVPQAAGRAFDLGCGVGGALVHLRSQGWEVAGIEPDPVLAEVGRSRFDLPVTTGYFSSETASQFGTLDLVYSCHVWEHLQDPRDVAAGAHTLLEERKGHLMIVVPTFVRSRTQAWKCFNASHTVMFSHVTLGRVLREAGFEPIARRYVADADSELWMIARAGGSQIAAPPKSEDLASVQRALMSAPFKAPLGLPARLVKHIRTALSDPKDFSERVRRALAPRLRR